MHNAVATAEALAKRISSIHPICQVCKSSTEDVVPALFLCSHARATWFLLPLGLKSDMLQSLGFKEILQKLWEQVQPRDLLIFLSTTWNIWKARCSFLFAGKPCQPHNTMSEALNLINMCTLASGGSRERVRVTNADLPETLEWHLGENFCWVDGWFF